MQPYYRSLGWKQGDFKEAEAYYSKCLSIPIFSDFKGREEQKYIIETIKSFKKNETMNVILNNQELDYSKVHIVLEAGTNSHRDRNS